SGRRPFAHSEEDPAMTDQPRPDDLSSSSAPQEAAPVEQTVDQASASAAPAPGKPPGSHPSSAGSAADRNLLFGILALQMDFISRDALIAAMHAWVLDKRKTLGQVLVAQQALRPDKYQLLEALVQAHLEQHGDQVANSLAAVSSATPLRRELEQ